MTDDYSANTATTGVVAMGDSVKDDVEVLGDSDCLNQSAFLIAEASIWRPFRWRMRQTMRASYQIGSKIIDC